MSSDTVLFILTTVKPQHTHTVYLPETSDWPTARHPYEGELLVFAERAVTTDGRYMFPVELVQGRFRPA